MRCGTRFMIAFIVVTAILVLFDLMLMIVTALACCGVVVLGDIGGRSGAIVDRRHVVDFGVCAHVLLTGRGCPCVQP